MKKSSLFLFGAILFLSISVTNGQIKVSTAGKVTIGDTYDATPLVELKDQSYLMFNAHDNQSGILFHEVYGKSATSVQYGAFLEYDEPSDALKLGTYQNNSKLDGIFLRREHGHVGIGAINTSWTYELKVTADAHITNNLLVGGAAWVNGTQVVTSDINVKTNIEKLDGKSLLDKLTLLEGKTYEYKNKNELEAFFQSSSTTSTTSQNSDSDSTSKQSEIIEMPNFPEGRKYGLIAQEVKDVFPEAVEYDSTQNLFGINYNAFIPILLEAIKEQQSVINEMQSEILELKGGNLKSLLLSKENESLVSDQCHLHQNMPNPFGETTSIRYSLPKGITNADIIIYDMTGKQLRRVPLTEDGESSIQVQGGEMDPGIYMYSMIVNNQLIDTKQMIITD